MLADSDLGAATGTPYHLVPLNGSADNAAVLPQIEKAVDSGQPVPINVTDGKGDNHQMVIVGRGPTRSSCRRPETRPAAGGLGIQSRGSAGRIARREDAVALLTRVGPGRHSQSLEQPLKVEPDLGRERAIAVDTASFRQL